MCTVSFLPNKDGGFVFTSNRDEAVSRKTSPPEIYNYNGVKVLCPKDDLAGGTWIGVSSKSRLVCLLNGGFVKHERKNNYRHSRGKIVIDFLVVGDYKKVLNSYDLNDIEPFTLIILDWQNALEMF